MAYTNPKRIMNTPFGSSVEYTPTPDRYTTPTVPEVEAELPEWRLQASAYRLKQDVETPAETNMPVAYNKNTYKPQTRAEIYKKYGFEKPADSVSGVKYISERFKASAAEQARAQLSAPNAMAEVGKSLWEKITGITQAESNAAGAELTRYMDQAGYKRPSVAPVTKAVESLKTSQQKSEAKIAQMEASGQIGKGTKFLGELASVAVQQAGFAIEAATGVPTGTLGVFTSYVNRELDQGGTASEIVAAGAKGIISGQIEKRFFNMFKFLTPAGRKATGFLNNILAKKVSPAVMKSPIFAAVEKLVRSGAGEGIEEWVNTYTDAVADWAIVNPGKPISEWLNKQTFNEANYSAKMGAAIGAILGSVQLLEKRTATTDDKILSSITKDVAEIPIGDIETPDAVEKIELLNHVIAGKQVTPAASTGSLVEDYFATKEAESVTITQATTIPATAENITLDERVKTLVYRDETTGNFVIVEPISHDILGDAEKLNDAVTQVRKVLDNADTNAKYYSDQQGKDINEWAGIPVTQVTPSITSPLEAPTSVSDVRQASNITSAIETPTSAPISVPAPYSTTVSPTTGKIEPWALTRDQYVNQFNRYENVVKRGESRVEAQNGKISPEATPELWALLQESYAKNDFRLFSATRGYTENEMNDYQRWLEIAGNGKGLDYSVQDPELYHKQLVEIAVKEGRPVPEKVLNEYPGLKAIADKAKSERVISPEPKATQPVSTPVKSLSATIDEISANATDITDAETRFNDAVKSNPTIIDEAGKGISTIEDYETRLAELANQLKAQGKELPKSLQWKMNLQLLALKRFAERVLDVPKDSRAYSFMNNMVTYLGKTVDEQKMIDFEDQIEDMFYEQLHNKDVVAAARTVMDAKDKKAKQKKLDSLYDKLTLRGTKANKGQTTYDIEPYEMVALGMYAKELIENGDENDIIKADVIVRKISERMKTAGQFTQAAKALYEVIYPEIRAKRLIKEVDKTNDPIESADLDKRTKATEKIINDNRKASAVGATENLFNDTETPAEYLKKRIESDLHPKSDKDKSDIAFMVQTLFRVYKETNPTQAAPADPYEAVARIAMSKDRYAAVWNRAKELILARGAFEPELVAYMERLADPVMTKSLMDRAISQTVKAMKSSPLELAKRFFATGGESVSEFVDVLRSNMPDLDEESFDYVKTQLVARFKQQMLDRRTRMIDQLAKQYDESGNKILQRNKKEIKQRTVDQLIDVAFKQSLDIESIRRTWADRMGLASITEDMKNDIYDTMRKIAVMTDEEMRENAYFDLVKRISATMPGSAYDKFLAWRRFSMLMSPVSWIKNGVSNIASMPFYYATDRLENLFNKLGGAEVSTDNRIAGEKWIKEGADPLIDLVVNRYSTPERIKRMVESSAKYTIGKLIASEKRIFKNSKLEKLTKIPYHVMSEGKFTADAEFSIAFLGDTYMFQHHFRAALRNRLNALNYTTAATAEDMTKIAKQAADDAMETAIIRTYRKVSTVAAKLQTLKSGAMVSQAIQRAVDKGDIEGARKIRRNATAVNAAVDIMIPFVVTPVAIVEQGYKFSPLALAVELGRLGVYEVNKTILKKAPSASQLADIHHGLAQALAGTGGQFIVGMIAGFLGVLTGSAPEDEKERLMWAQIGKKPYSIYIPGVGSLSLDWMQPVSMTLMMGAEFADKALDKNLSFAGMGEAAMDSIDALFSNTIATDLQSKFGGSYDQSFAGAIKDTLIDGALQGLPGITRRINRVFDRYERDVYTGSSFNVIKNRILSSIPFGTFAIPPKVDIWGNKVDQVAGTNTVTGLVPRTITNLLSPFIYKGADRDPVTVEASRLFESTNESSALPIVANESISTKIKGTEYALKLEGNDWADYQQVFGQLMHEYAQIVMDSDKYKSADDTKRVGYLKKAYSEASADAKKQYITDYFHLS